MNKRNRPTLRDIAQRSGYSLGTVSQALSHKPGVARDTRERIFEVAQEMGYRFPPRKHVRSPDEATTIGLLVKQDHHLPYLANPPYSRVLAGVERECQRHGFTLMLASVDVDSMNRVVNWPPLLFDGRVDGLIVVGAFRQHALAQIENQAAAIVLVDDYAPGLRIDSIVADNLNGAQAAVAHLIERGHTRIGLVGGTASAFPGIRERRKGYTRALEQAGITTTTIEDSLLTRESGYDATLRLLRQSPDVTAIFACNDEVAMGVLDAAHDLNLAVPDDLSLVGFDNIDLAQDLTPRLTTVNIDKALMGVLGVRQLRDRFAHPEHASLTIVVGTELVVRDSVRDLRA